MVKNENVESKRISLLVEMKKLIYKNAIRLDMYVSISIGKIILFKLNTNKKGLC